MANNSINASKTTSAITKNLQSLVDMVDGLLAICFTDHDGNSIISAHSSTDSDAQHILQNSLLASFSFASEQGPKMNTGKCNSVVFEYGKYKIVTLYSSKVTTIFLAKSDANVGQILELEESLSPILDIFSNMVMADSPFEK